MTLALLATCAITQACAARARRRSPARRSQAEAAPSNCDSRCKGAALDGISAFTASNSGSISNSADGASAASAVRTGDRAGDNCARDSAGERRNRANRGRGHRPHRLCDRAIAARTGLAGGAGGQGRQPGGAASDADGTSAVRHARCRRRRPRRRAIPQLSANNPRRGIERSGYELRDLRVDAE